MGYYPCKYLGTRKCCCCFNCDPRQVFLILSSACLLLGVVNMCSYPLCLAIIVSSLVLAFYYFGCGVFLLVAITGNKGGSIYAFPWLMIVSYIPIAAYVACLVMNIDCIEAWTIHHKTGENQPHELKIGLLALYASFAVIDFLFSTYALMLSIGHLDDKTMEDEASV